MTAIRIHEPAPMLEMNTTPLIDVMLVLLIMFIITIPMQSHAVKLDLPTSVKNPFPPPDRLKNVVVVTRPGAILWNGSAIPIAGLRYNLAATQRMNPIPELHLRPDADARYETVDEVLAVTKRAHVEKMGFVGNEAYANF